MNYIPSYLSGSVADALGWTLLHAIWQGFALVLPTALMLHLLRNQSSMLRYRLSVSTLLIQVLLSAATFVWFYQPAVNPLVHAPSQIMTARYTAPISWQLATQTLPWHRQMQQFLEAHLSQFVLIYLIGVALFGLRLVGGWVYLQRLGQTATQPTTVIWAHLTDKLRLTLSVRVSIRVRESMQIAVPMIVGVLKPILLVPIGLAAHLTTSEIEAVLAHELAHVKRHDYAVNLLQSVVEVLYFFHPALWWLSARVREEREHCCDDLAVQVCGGNGRILAQALARVEELRLAQPDQTPALAMAFASNQRQLLHRVRRMLGVPTRPFVSNGSLAGLTLATILLMSLSVYAVQQQDKPKSESTPPRPAHSTRRHSVSNGTEYGMVDGKKVDYMVWKGHKLSASRVARLQRQLDQIMAGKLSLDAVAQPDRDILLTIIETTYSLESGMNSLAEGLTSLNDNNIVASATVPLSSYSPVEGDSSQDAFAPIHKASRSADSLDKQRAYYQRQMDSLSQLISQRSQQVQVIRLHMEKLQFPVEEMNRANDVLQWRKEKLIEQRNALLDKHQRLLHNDGKQKLTQAEVEKQVAALEPEIKKLEGNMEELNKQFELSNAKQYELKQPMDKLQREAEQLDEQIGKLSEEISKYGDDLTRTMSDFDLDVNVSTRPNRRPNLARIPVPPVPPSATARSIKSGLRPAISVGRPHALPKPARAPKAARPELPEPPEAKEKPN